MYHGKLSFAGLGAGRYLRLMKLYRFRYSPYARKVQMLLDLMGRAYELIEVPYGDRTELATLTGGHVMVPVLVTDDGKVIVESRDICEALLAGRASAELVPSPSQGAVWAYADFCDGPLEDVLFRIASPAVRDRWERASDRAMYVFVKERKFGAGCVSAWERDRDALVAKAKHLLAPTLQTLAERPFVFGERPTLADAALYGLCAMLEEGDVRLLERVSPELLSYMRRVERAGPAANASSRG